MFVARKKQKKETPQWKLDMEAAAADASAGGGSSRPAASSSAAAAPEVAPARTADLPKEARPASSAATAHEPPSPSGTWAGAAAATADDDDDDDDDDFDASKYDLGGGEEDKDDEPEGRPCTVKVTGIAHETSGDHLRAFFSEYGSVSKVLRAVDVRDRTAFLTFESPVAAAAAYAAGRNGATLHGHELSVELAPDAPSAPPRSAGWAAAEQRARLERDDPISSIGYDARKVAGRGSVTGPMRGVVFSGDHAPGGKQKQGREAAYGMPSPYAPGGGAHFGGGSPAGGWRTLGDGSRMPPGIEPTAGDWRCSACQNWNFARRIACNKCGESKLRPR